MRTFNLLFLFIASLGVFSCHQNASKEPVLIENVEISFDVKSFNNYKQLAVLDTTLVIALSEDLENYLIIGQLDKIVVSDSLIYIADTYMKRLLVYDMQGNIVGRVGTVGGGPGEYTSLSDFCVGIAGEIYLYDSGSNKMLEYDRNLKFVNSLPISFKAEHFQLLGNNFLFGLTPYNGEDRTLGKMIVLTDRSFNPLTSALIYSDHVDPNYEFFSPMTPCKSGALYNRLIDNDVYLFDKSGSICRKFHFDFGQLNVSMEDLKDINALLSSNKSYCYVASPPVLVGDLLMGVLNNTGEMFTFVYDSTSKQVSLNALSDFSVGNINLPITTCANGGQLVSYFNQDIYPDFENSDKLSSVVKGKVEKGTFVLCINRMTEKSPI